MPKLKRNVAPLMGRGVGSITLAIELFNRPSDVGRQHAVVILLHHAFEMLLKAAILQSTGTINREGDPYTYGFARCLTIATEELDLLDNDERATLTILDNQRDVATHYYAEVSEDVLYVHAQSAVTLFNKLLRVAFKEYLADYIPGRVLPVSAHPPTDLTLLLDRELLEVDEMLTGKKRRGAQAAAKLRSLLAFTSAVRNDRERVNEGEIDSAIARRRKGQEWSVILPEVTQLKLSSDGSGVPMALRIVRQGAVPALRVAQPGEPSDGIVVPRDVNVWDKFNLSRDNLAEKIGLTGPKTHALIYELNLQADEGCFKTWKHKNTPHSGYSKKALEKLTAAMSTVDMKAVWDKHKHRLGAGKRKK